MKILVIDTSCDESCAAILDTESWKLLADVVYSHTAKMEAFGGVVPEVASREHLKALPRAVAEALQTAGLDKHSIDHVAVTHRPGLIGALLVGVTYAKAFAYALEIPFSVHDHVYCHVLSPCLASLDGGSAPAFPWIALVVSGGHTELFHVQDVGKIKWLGGTADDAAGEAFDKIGKLLGLPYPAGPQIDRWVRASATQEDRTRFEFPRSKPDRFGFSFSGLKTSVLQKCQSSLKLERSRSSFADLPESVRLALAASAQEAILDPLIDRAQFAARELQTPQIVVTGGVACNSRLRERLPKAYFPSPKHCSDNAAMVAMLAALEHRAGCLTPAPWTTTPNAYASFA